MSPRELVFIVAAVVRGIVRPEIPNFALGALQDDDAPEAQRDEAAS